MKRRLRLLARQQLREFEGNSAPAQPAVPVRVLRQVLLVVVRSEAGNLRKYTHLQTRSISTGRLSVDLSCIPSADQNVSPITQYLCDLASPRYNFYTFIIPAW